jgi:hypothetical protein
MEQTTHTLIRGIRAELLSEYNQDGKPADRFDWTYKKLIEARLKIKEIDVAQREACTSKASAEDVAGYPV